MIKFEGHVKNTAVVIAATEQRVWERQFEQWITQKSDCTLMKIYKYIYILYIYTIFDKARKIFIRTSVRRICASVSAISVAPSITSTPIFFYSVRLFFFFFISFFSFQHFLVLCGFFMAHFRMNEENALV